MRGGARKSIGLLIRRPTVWTMRARKLTQFLVPTVLRGNAYPCSAPLPLRAFALRSFGAMIALTLVSAALLCACSPAAPVREAPKHVIVICIDALRADHLGAYGYHRNTSPTIDRLAREGVLFERAFSNSSFTGESVSTIFTGAYPSRTPWGGGWYAAPDPSVRISRPE